MAQKIQLVERPPKKAQWSCYLPEDQLELAGMNKKGLPITITAKGPGVLEIRREGQ